MGEITQGSRPFPKVRHLMNNFHFPIIFMDFIWEMRLLWFMQFWTFWYHQSLRKKARYFPRCCVTLLPYGLGKNMEIMPQLNPSLNLSECFLSMSTPLPRLWCSHHRHSVQAGTPAHTWNEGGTAGRHFGWPFSPAPNHPLQQGQKERKKKGGDRGALLPL